jgi:hypothetical protein
MYFEASAIWPEATMETAAWFIPKLQINLAEIMKVVIYILVYTDQGQNNNRLKWKYIADGIRISPPSPNDTMTRCLWQGKRGLPQRLQQLKARKRAAYDP